MVRLAASGCRQKHVLRSTTGSCISARPRAAGLVRAYVPCREQACTHGYHLVYSLRTRSLRPVAAAAAEVDTNRGIATTILLPDCQLAFGDRVKAVGEVGALGHWDVKDAQELQWSEGHNWQLDLVLPPGHVDFKLVIVHGDDSVFWEGGINRSIQVPGNGAGHLELKCTFNNPDTETKVTPAGLDAPPQPAAATEHVPDEPDSQIAADLELDSFSAGDAAPEEQAQGAVQHEEPPAEQVPAQPLAQNGKPSAPEAEAAPAEEAAPDQPGQSETAAFATMGKAKVTAVDNGAITFTFEEDDESAATFAETVLSKGKGK